MKRIVWWLLLGSVVLFAATGCSELGVEDILGTWETRSVNGDPVPGSVQVNPGDRTVDIAYEHWTFMDGGECTIVGQYDGAISIRGRDDCDYTVNVGQETIAVTLFRSFDMRGSVDGSRMTLTDEDDNLFVLRKQ